MKDAISQDVLGLTARIVAAHVGHNEVSADVLPAMIRSVYQSLVAAGSPGSLPAAAPIPAVPIKRSVFPDFIVCLEDGKKLKMLKRHLMVSYGMTPVDYRAKWGLPPDYPMVAPNYAATRSSMAKGLGLGRKRPAETSEPASTGSDGPTVTMVPARRARGARG